MRRALAAVLLFALAACNGFGNAGVSGSGTQGFVPGERGAVLPDRRHRKRKRVHAYAQIVIPRKRHRSRNPKYISPSTKGIEIDADSNGSGTFVQTTVVALGPTAPDCQTTSSGFLCIVVATVWEGDNTITVTTYDTAPTGGTIPPSAQILGTSKVTTTVTAGQTPYISIFLGGQIGSIGAKPAFSTAPADGASHDVAIVVDPKDFGNHKITAGKNDPYANPIHVSLGETGGNGHAVLLLDGTASGSTATIKFSTDTLGVRYDGGGKPGYSISVQLAASGAPSETLQVSPLIVGGPGIAAHALGLNGAAVSNALTITEANAPASQTYSVSRAGCAGIATTSGFSGSGASAAVTATGGATASASGCTISITDGNATTLALPVSNTPIAGGVTVNGVRVTEYGVGASPGPLAVGPDNNVYVIGNYGSGGGGSEVIPLKPTSGAPAMGTALPVGNGGIFDITSGSDGALWMTSEGNTGVYRLTTSGAVTSFPSPNSNMDCPPMGITTLGGDLWATGCGELVDLTVGGGFSRFTTSTLSNPTAIVRGADGALYVADGTNVDRYDPGTQSFTQIAEPNGATIAYLTSAPHDGASGAIWYTSLLVSTTTNGYAGRIDIGTQTATTMATIASDQLNGIAAGADGAVWFADSTNNSVNRLPMTGGSVQSIPLPSAASNPSFITLGPDGSLWLSENSSGNVVHIIP